MNLSKKFALISALMIFQLNTASAAVDDELARIAAEQNRSDRVEIFDPNPAPETKSQQELKDEEKRLEDERKAARKKIEEERKKARDEISGKAPISKNPAPPERQPKNPESPPVENVRPVAQIQPVETQPVYQEPEPVVQQPASLPNPIVEYASYEEIVRAVNFTPLYIPKKVGYTITAILAIDNRVAEIRYGRRWEPSVSLHVRTYRRAAGEDLRDVSGVNGVKWRVNVSNGTQIYIAKIDETHHVAAWAVGNYTFSAYVENLSFAAFHSLVVDDLIDLTQHYYLL